MRGELWKISLCPSRQDYCGKVYITEGVGQFGGLAITPDGLVIYAGATLDNGTQVLLSANTQDSRETYKVLALTEHQPNGLAADWENEVLYFTDEGARNYNYDIILYAYINMIQDLETIKMEL